MKTDDQIFITNDYSIFKKLPGNREINKPHVLKLKNSFEKKYLNTVIKVNENFEIIDGQHRFEAAKLLGLPIKYQIESGYGIKEVQVLNQNSKNWDSQSYLNTFCDLNFPEYKKFKLFMDLFPDFGFKTCMTIIFFNTGYDSVKTMKNEECITDSNKSGSFRFYNFKSGDIIIPDLELSISYGNKIMQLKKHFKFFNNVTFVRAMVILFKMDIYNHDRFLAKLDKHSTDIKQTVRIKDYILQINTVYNFHVRKSDKVFFPY